MYMLSFFYIYSSRRRHIALRREHKKQGDREKVLWANLTANPLAKARKAWRVRVGDIDHSGIQESSLGGKVEGDRTFWNSKG